MPHTNTVALDQVTYLRTQTSGPGPRLRAAREALGLTVNDIAKRMRLQEHIIQQIEQDMYDENTALVFVKGYLRSYAVLVGLNPDQIIQDFVAIGLSEDRDAPDLTKLIKKNDKPRRVSIPLKLQSNPMILWVSVGAVVLAIVGVLWAYAGSITKIMHHSSGVTAPHELNASAVMTPATTDAVDSSLGATVAPALGVEANVPPSSSPSSPAATATSTATASKTQNSDVKVVAQPKSATSASKADTNADPLF